MALLPPRVRSVVGSSSIGSSLLERTDTVSAHAAIERGRASNCTIQKYNSHAARNLVTSNVFAGSGINGWMFSLHEGMRSNLNRNEHDLLNGSYRASALHLLVRRSGSSGMVLNQDVS